MKTFKVYATKSVTDHGLQQRTRRFLGRYKGLSYHSAASAAHRSHPSEIHFVVEDGSGGEAISFEKRNPSERHSWDSYINQHTLSELRKMYSAAHGRGHTDRAKKILEAIKKKVGFNKKLRASKKNPRRKKYRVRKNFKRYGIRKKISRRRRSRK